MEVSAVVVRKAQEPIARQHYVLDHLSMRKLVIYVFGDLPSKLPYRFSTTYSSGTRPNPIPKYPDSAKEHYQQGQLLVCAPLL